MSDWPIPPIAASPVPPTRCSTPSTRRRGQSSGRARTKSRAGITGAASPSPTAACTSARSTACSIALGSRGSFMKNRHAVLLFGLFPALTHAQFGRGGGDWMTAGSDAQRSSWIRTDAKISPASLRKGGFDITFKIAADPSARQSLAAPLTLNSYIDRKSTRLNSSLVAISYAVFCLKKKKEMHVNYCLFAASARILGACNAPGSPDLSPIFEFFFCNDAATTEIYTLSLHDALPISAVAGSGASSACGAGGSGSAAGASA